MTQPELARQNNNPSAITARKSWSVVALLWLAFLLNYIDRQMVFSIYPSLRIDLGFTQTQLGLIGSIFLWIYSLSSALMGRVADVFPKDRLIIWCLALWSLATLATGLSHSVNMFLFWRGVMGVTESLYLPSSIALIAILHTGRTRSTALALHQTAQMIGIILGGWGGGWMADRFGWRSAFLLLAITGLVYAPVLRVGLARLPHPPSRARSAAGWAQMFRSKCYLALAAAFTAYCVMLWMLYAWFPSHLYDKFHLSQADSGLAATLYLQGSTAAGVLFWGVIADRLVRRLKAARFFVTGAGILFCAPFAYLAVSLDSLIWVKVASLGFGFFAGGLHSNFSSATYDVVSTENYGVSVGALNLIGGVSGGVAVFLVGARNDPSSITQLMAWGASASAAAALMMLVIVQLHFTQENGRAAAITTSV